MPLHINRRQNRFFLGWALLTLQARSVKQRLRVLTTETKAWQCKQSLANDSNVQLQWKTVHVNRVRTPPQAWFSRYLNDQSANQSSSKWNWKNNLLQRKFLPAACFCLIYYQNCFQEVSLWIQRCLHSERRQGCSGRPFSPAGSGTPGAERPPRRAHCSALLTSTLRQMTVFWS